MSLCLNYTRRMYSEVYFGMCTVLMIVVGFPTCIASVGFVLNYKFCMKYDEGTDAMVGGLTVCESITWLMTCGKAMQVPRKEMDAAVAKFMAESSQPE